MKNGIATLKSVKFLLPFVQVSEKHMPISHCAWRMDTGSPYVRIIAIRETTRPRIVLGHSDNSDE
jgi:hypothetical protein